MSHLTRGLILAALFACLNALSSHAEEATGDDGGPSSQADEILDGPFEGAADTDEVFSPEGITGDWGGYRTWLSDHGLELSADLTTTLQGVMDGGLDEAARVGGSSELIMDIDIEKLGLWPLEEVPVVLVNLHRDDPGSRQVIGQARLQEIHKVRESRVVADDHQAVEAVVLCHDDVEYLVE